MTTPITPASPFRWFMKSLDTGRRNPQAVFGGFLLLLMVAMVPSVVQGVVEYALRPPATTIAVVYGLVMLFSLLVMPPIMGGALRLMHRCEHGQPAKASDVFEGFLDRDLAVRMITTALVCMLVYILLFGLLYLVMPSKGFVIELFSRSMSTPPGAQPDMSGLPAPSPWLLLWLPAALAVLSIGMHGYMLAYVVAALGNRGGTDATFLGFAALGRHLLAFAVFTAATVVVGGVLLLILALVVGLVIGLLAVLSPALAVVVAVPVYLGLMLVLYVVMFGFYYHAWRDIFGESADAPADALEA